jgi:hypothetical protein
LLSWQIHTLKTVGQINLQPNACARQSINDEFDKVIASIAMCQKKQKRISQRQESANVRSLSKHKTTSQFIDGSNAATQHKTQNNFAVY